jgi:hypothetical protein
VQDRLTGRALSSWLRTEIGAVRSDHRWLPVVVSVGLGEEVVRPLAVFGERSGGVVLFGVGRESRGTSIDRECTRRGPVVSVLRGVGPDGKAVGLDRREVHPSGTGGVCVARGRAGRESRGP